MYNPKTSQTIDEESEVEPITPYGRTKLKQEKLVIEFAKNTSFKCIIGRAVSVYGPKQNLKKPQGLISKLCISALTNKELEIFVPISTTRNYLYSGDVAKMIEHCLIMAHEDKIEFKNHSLIKILCNSESSSIASICKATEVVMRKRVLLRLKLSAKNQLYPPHFNIRSSVLPDLSGLCQTTLIAGVGSVRNDVIQRIQNRN
jgi:UDP-glucose 4-epimerase